MNYALLGFVIGCLLTWLVMVRAQNRHQLKRARILDILMTKQKEHWFPRNQALEAALTEANHRLAAFERTRGPNGQFVRKGEQ